MKHFNLSKAKRRERIVALLWWLAAIGAAVGISYLVGCELKIPELGSAAPREIDRTATITWEAPTTNADGSPLADLAGYRLTHTAPDGTVTTITVDAASTGAAAADLADGLHSWTVTAIDAAGNESSAAGPGTKKIGD